MYDAGFLRTAPTLELAQIVRPILPSEFFRRWNFIFSRVRTVSIIDISAGNFALNGLSQIIENLSLHHNVYLRLIADVNTISCMVFPRLVDMLWLESFHSGAG